jgi:hypothetical protein
LLLDEHPAKAAATEPTSAAATTRKEEVFMGELEIARNGFVRDVGGHSHRTRSATRTCLEAGRVEY